MAFSGEVLFEHEPGSLGSWRIGQLVAIDFWERLEITKGTGQ